MDASSYSPTAKSRPSPSRNLLQDDQVPADLPAAVLADPELVQAHEPQRRAAGDQPAQVLLAVGDPARVALHPAPARGREPPGLAGRAQLRGEGEEPAFNHTDEILG